MKKGLTDKRTDGRRLMEKTLAGIVSWANSAILFKSLLLLESWVVLWHRNTLTRLSKDNGPASKEPKETHNECILHFHKFHKVL